MCVGLCTRGHLLAFGSGATSAPTAAAVEMMNGCERAAFAEPVTVSVRFLGGQGKSESPGVSRRKKTSSGFNSLFLYLFI